MKGFSCKLNTSSLYASDSYGGRGWSGKDGSPTWVPLLKSYGSNI